MKFALCQGMSDAASGLRFTDVPWDELGKEPV